MPFKINLSEKGITYKLETDTEFLVGKKIGEKIEGKELKPELQGYELEITGTSDKAGFPGKGNIEGPALTGTLLTKGWGMKSRPRREGKGKKRRMPKGMRLKKTVRGNTISKDTIQINLKILKQGAKKLEEVFPKSPKEGEEKPTEQTKPEKQEAKPQTKEEKPETKEEVKEEKKPEENKEENK